MLVILFSLKIMGSLQNGVGTHFQVFPLFSMRTVSLASSWSCCSFELTLPIPIKLSVLRCIHTCVKLKPACVILDVSTKYVATKYTQRSRKCLKNLRTRCIISTSRLRYIHTDGVFTKFRFRSIYMARTALRMKFCAHYFLFVLIPSIF